MRFKDCICASVDRSLIANILSNTKDSSNIGRNIIEGPFLLGTNALRRWDFPRCTPYLFIQNLQIITVIALSLRHLRYQFIWFIVVDIRETHFNSIRTLMFIWIRGLLSINIRILIYQSLKMLWFL